MSGFLPRLERRGFVHLHSNSGSPISSRTLFLPSVPTVCTPRLGESLSPSRCDNEVVLSAHRPVLVLRTENLDPFVNSARRAPGYWFHQCRNICGCKTPRFGNSGLPSHVPLQSRGAKPGIFEPKLVKLLILPFCSSFFCHLYIFLLSGKGRSQHRGSLCFPCTSDLCPAKANQGKYLESGFVFKQLQMQKCSVALCQDCNK